MVLDTLESRGIREPLCLDPMNATKALVSWKISRDVVVVNTTDVWLDKSIKHYLSKLIYDGDFACNVLANASVAVFCP